MEEIRDLPAKILQQVYEFLQDKEDRKIWQLVCRDWYHAVNDDVARIKVMVPAGFLSYQKLAADLEKYPTFTSKILAISDKNADYPQPVLLEQKAKASFEELLNKCCTSLRRLTLSHWSLVWLHDKF